MSDHCVTENKCKQHCVSYFCSPKAIDNINTKALLAPNL